MNQNLKVDQKLKKNLGNLKNGSESKNGTKSRDGVKCSLSTDLMKQPKLPHASPFYHILQPSESLHKTHEDRSTNTYIYLFYLIYNYSWFSFHTLGPGRLNYRTVQVPKCT